MPKVPRQHLDRLDDDGDDDILPEQPKRRTKQAQNPVKAARRQAGKEWGREIAKFVRTAKKEDRVR
jgi:hypothetical protein